MRRSPLLLSSHHYHLHHLWFSIYLSFSLWFSFSVYLCHLGLFPCTEREQCKFIKSLFYKIIKLSGSLGSIQIFDSIWKRCHLPFRISSPRKKKGHNYDLFPDTYIAFYLKYAKSIILTRKLLWTPLWLWNKGYVSYWHCVIKDAYKI